jgi:predicted RNase H-like nuclease (RuvC/YqgF family)
MGVSNFILECEKHNKELVKDVEYYKRQNKRLKEKYEQLKNIIDKAQELIRDENSLSESDIDYLSELLDSYR